MKGVPNDGVPSEWMADVLREEIGRQGSLRAVALEVSAFTGEPLGTAERLIGGIVRDNLISNGRGLLTRRKHVYFNTAERVLLALGHENLLYERVAA